MCLIDPLLFKILKLNRQKRLKDFYFIVVNFYFPHCNLKLIHLYTPLYNTPNK